MLSRLKDRWWGKHLALVLFWAAAALLFVGMRFAAPALIGADLPDWSTQRWVILGWMMWVPMTYIAVWMARQFPLTGSRWGLYAPVHIVGAVACSATGGLLWNVLIWILTGGEIDFVERMRQSFVSAVPIDSIIYFAVLAGVYGFEYYRLHKEDQRRTERLRAELAEAELTTLRTQLNPHFLFNALNAVASHIRENAKEAVQMVAELGNFLRAVLELGGRHALPVEREIDMLRRYLAVQQIRFGGELAVSIRVDPAVRGALVPSLLLQPLTENAIHHGIRRRRGGGQIWIVAERIRDEAPAGEEASRGEGPPAGEDASTGENARPPDRVLLRVMDDGEGLQSASNSLPGPNRTDQNGSARRGLGIANVERRLHHLFGDDYLLSFGRSVHDGSRVTTVTIDIPYRQTVPRHIHVSDGQDLPQDASVELSASRRSGPHP